jgi:predicted nucleic acid-binding protein
MYCGLEQYDSFLLMATKRTTVLLEEKLLKEAASVLGTRRTTDTIRASLEQVLRQRHLRNLVDWRLPDSADAELAQQRKPRR